MSPKRSIVRAIVLRASLANASVMCWSPQEAGPGAEIDVQAPLCASHQAGRRRRRGSHAPIPPRNPATRPAADAAVAEVHERPAHWNAYSPVTTRRDVHSVDQDVGPTEISMRQATEHWTHVAP